MSEKRNSTLTKIKIKHQNRHHFFIWVFNDFVFFSAIEILIFAFLKLWPNRFEKLTRILICAVVSFIFGDIALNFLFCFLTRHWNCYFACRQPTLHCDWNLDMSESIPWAVVNLQWNRNETKMAHLVPPSGKKWRKTKRKKTFDTCKFWWWCNFWALPNPKH